MFGFREVLILNLGGWGAPNGMMGGPPGKQPMAPWDAGRGMPMHRGVPPGAPRGRYQGGPGGPPAGVDMSVPPPMDMHVSLIVRCFTTFWHMYKIELPQQEFAVILLFKRACDKNTFSGYGSTDGRYASASDARRNVEA